MRRIIMALVAAMFVCTAAMAQDGGERKMDKAAMVQKRTEAVVRKYGLDETQAKQLTELNTKYADKMMLPRQRGMRPGGRKGGNAPGARDGAQERKRPQLTEEQKAKFSERRKQMEETMKAYDTELKAIMTADQYKQYTEDMQKRRRPARK